MGCINEFSTVFTDVNYLGNVETLSNDDIQPLGQAEEEENRFHRDVLEEITTAHVGWLLFPYRALNFSLTQV